MGKGIRKLRAARGMSQEDLAASIGAARLDLARWEQGEGDPPDMLVKEMAVMFGCSAADVLGREIDVESEWWCTPFAVSQFHVPYGTLRLRFAVAEERVFPIDCRARAALASHVAGFHPSHVRPRCSPWLNGWSLDNRVIFGNPRHLTGLSLQPADYSPMPGYGHPEVYRTLEDWDDTDAAALPPLFRREWDAEIAARAGDADPGQRDREMLLLWSDGREEWLGFRSADLLDLYYLELDTHDVPANAFVKISSGGGDRVTPINLEHVALLSLPRERWHRLTASHPAGA